MSFTSPGCPELLQRVVTDGLEHVESWLVLRCIGKRTNEALVGEGSQAIQHVRYAVALSGDVFGSFERPAASEDGESPKERLLIGRKQIAAVESGPQ